MTKSFLSEIYSAIQGEGPLVGIRQIFIRFSACDLRCVWCDTPDSLVKTKHCEVEATSGSRSFEKVKNPVNSIDLLSFILKLSPKLHHSISLTGGEPLLQYKFLLDFLPQLKKEQQIPIYLESGGHRPEELEKIINLIDYISMDFKLPSSASAGNLWDSHKNFLAVSLSAKNVVSVWVKIVITSDTSIGELFHSVEIIKSVLKESKNNKNIEIILQPVSRINGSKPPDEVMLLDIHSKILSVYPYVRVLPQVHKLIKQR